MRESLEEADRVVLPERIVRKLGKFPTSTEECWLWEGAMSHGYPKISDGHTSRGVMGRLWVLLTHNFPRRTTQQFPLCGRGKCVNPWHRDYVMRGRGHSYWRPQTLRSKRMNTCQRGHPLRDYNSVVMRNGHTRCRLCLSRYQEAYYGRYPSHMAVKLEAAIAAYRAGDVEALQKERVKRGGP